MPPFLTRREALGGAAVALVLASCGGGDPAPPGTGGPGSGVGLLSSLLAFEHAVIAAYGACEEVVSGRVLRELRAIRAQERSSAMALEKLITDLGGEPPEGKSAAEYAREFPRLGTPADALRFAQDLEERQVRANLEALTKLPGADLRFQAVGGLGDHPEHLAAVRVLQGLPAAEGPFVTGAL
jgi:Ferritin-like domain